MERNNNYVLKATLVKPGAKLTEFEPKFDKMKEDFNQKQVKNQKEIESITMSLENDEENVVIINLWTEKALPDGRELQSARRISQALSNLSGGKIVANGNRVLKSVTSVEVN